MLCTRHIASRNSIKVSLFLYNNYTTKDIFCQPRVLGSRSRDAIGTIIALSRLERSRIRYGMVSASECVEVLSVLGGNLPFIVRDLGYSKLANVDGLAAHLARMVVELDKL